MNPVLLAAGHAAPPTLRGLTWLAFGAAALIVCLILAGALARSALAERREAVTFREMALNNQRELDRMTEQARIERAGQAAFIERQRGREASLVGVDLDDCEIPDALLDLLPAAR